MLDSLKIREVIFALPLTTLMAFGVFVFNSCSDKKAEYILSEEKMVDILTDLQIVKAADEFRNYENPLIVDYNDPVLFVLKKHGITENRLKQSNTYYSNHPNLYKHIMKDVWKRLETLQHEKEISQDSTSKNK